MSGTPSVPGSRASLSAVPRAAVARIAPFAAFIVLLALQSFVDERWARGLTLARPFAAAALLAFFWRDYSELRGAPRTRLREWPLAIAVGIAVFLAWITLDRGWMVIGGGRGFVPLDEAGRIDVPVALARLAGLAIIVPVMEELFWRSFVMRWVISRDFLAIDPRRATLGAVAISSALFASEHSLWLAGLVAGLAYAWLYVRSGNLRVAVLSHATTNAILGLWILATGRWSLW